MDLKAISPEIEKNGSEEKSRARFGGPVQDRVRDLGRCRGRPHIRQDGTQVGLLNILTFKIQSTKFSIDH